MEEVLPCQERYHILRDICRDRTQLQEVGDIICTSEVVPHDTFVRRNV
jgi:hypothetical protein